LAIIVAKTAKRPDGFNRGLAKSAKKALAAPPTVVNGHRFDPAAMLG
jgi:hypothetical protein